jgi:hypothetical protein
MPQATDPAQAAKLKHASRTLIRAGVLEMALGVLWMVWGFAGHGLIVRVGGGIAIMCGGLVILGYGLAARRKGRGG